MGFAVAGNSRHAERRPLLPQPKARARSPAKVVLKPVPKVRLRKYGESVLTALVRFLLTDSLGSLEVIDEEHPALQRERLLQMRPLGPAPGIMPEASEDREWSRPTQHRASSGLLLRSELSDLRSIGRTLGLDRLTGLCDQLLQRADLPGAPAVFVPASTIAAAMSTLRQQMLLGPSRDGADTRVLCGSPQPRVGEWGHRRVPTQGVLWAHGFVLCAGCESIRLEPGGDAAAEGFREWQGVCWLKRCSASSVGSPLRYELDLRDVPTDIVLAWLRYLYTQEDLSIIWPCEGETPEEVAAAERFWADLLRLAQRVGDEKLQLYAQDTLVGAISASNWVHLAMFAEQAQCYILSEAALMTGFRLLLPAMMHSFKVTTGLERDENIIKEGAEAEKDEASSSSAGVLPEQFATVGRVAAGRPGSSWGKVDLELEKHLLEMQGVDTMSVLALRKGSPGQFAELKHRLAEAVVGAQKTAVQLKNCAQFYDAQEKKGAQDPFPSYRAIGAEILVLAAIIAIFLLPGTWRQTVFKAASSLLGSRTWIISWITLPDVSWLSALVPDSVRIVALNVLVLLALAAVIWNGMNGD